MAGRSNSGGRNLGPDSPIPDKLFFKIGEVSTLVGVQPHVLRYWEKEVSSIRPGKTASNQRRYRRKDLEVFREIRRLLYEEKFTLAGARKRLLAAASGDSEVPLGSADESQSTEPLPLVKTPGKTKSQSAPSATQLSLHFVDEKARIHIENAKVSLREVVAMCGEEVQS